MGLVETETVVLYNAFIHSSHPAVCVCLDVWVSHSWDWTGLRHFNL